MTTVSSVNWSTFQSITQPHQLERNESQAWTPFVTS